MQGEIQIANAKSREQLSLHQTRISRVEDENSGLQGQIKKLEAMQKDLTTQKDGLSIVVQSKQKEIKELQEAQKLLADLVGDQALQLRDLQRQSEDLQKKLQTKETALQNQTAKHKEQKASWNERNGQAHEQLDQQYEVGKTLQKELDRANESSSAQEARIKQLELEKEAQQQLQQAEAEVRKKREEDSKKRRAAFFAETFAGNATKLGIAAAVKRRMEDRLKQTQDEFVKKQKNFESELRKKNQHTDELRVALEKQITQLQEEVKKLTEKKDFAFTESSASQLGRSAIVSSQDADANQLKIEELLEEVAAKEADIMQLTTSIEKVVAENNELLEKNRIEQANIAQERKLFEQQNKQLMEQLKQLQTQQAEEQQPKQKTVKPKTVSKSIQTEDEWKDEMQTQKLKSERAEDELHRRMKEFERRELEIEKRETEAQALESALQSDMENIQLRKYVLQQEEIRLEELRKELEGTSKSLQASEFGPNSASQLGSQIVRTDQLGEFFPKVNWSDWDTGVEAIKKEVSSIVEISDQEERLEALRLYKERVQKEVEALQNGKKLFEEYNKKVFMRLEASFKEEVSQ